MAEKLDPKDLVTLEELALSTMWETSALVEVLKRKGNYGERFSSNGCEVRSDEAHACHDIPLPNHRR